MQGTQASMAKARPAGIAEQHSKTLELGKSKLRILQVALSHTKLRVHATLRLMHTALLLFFTSV